MKPNRNSRPLHHESGQTAEHDLSKDLRRRTEERPGEGSESMRPYLEPGRRLGPPSEGRSTAYFC